MAWCRRGDLNPHGLPHTPLKRACLPVPPLRPNPRNGVQLFAASARGSAPALRLPRGGEGSGGLYPNEPPACQRKSPLSSSVANLLEWPRVKEIAVVPDEMEEF